ncbi:MAG: MBL fold metallo-hydrolase [Hyphomicrobiales bacterium]
MKISPLLKLIVLVNVIFCFNCSNTQIDNTPMVTIEKLVFNPFQVNTFIIYDETKECVIVDAACYGSDEEQILADFIKDKGLKPVHLIDTHCHIDHILGNRFAATTYNLELSAHRDSEFFVERSLESAAMYGFKLENPLMPSIYLKEGDEVKFGNSKLKIAEAPGHANGSICLISEEGNFVVTGDVLFKDSIGRTDLPTGDLDLLLSNIKEKLFVLDKDMKVHPGHGPETSIGYEKQNNPFVKGFDKGIE